MTRAVQVTYLIPIDDEADIFPDAGVAGLGYSDEEIIEQALESLAELIAQEGIQGGEIVEVE